MSNYLDAYLLDTCAWSLMRQEREAHLWDLWADEIDEGRMWVCDPVRLEMLTSARNGNERDLFSSELFDLFGGRRSRRTVVCGSWPTPSTLSLRRRVSSGTRGRGHSLVRYSSTPRHDRGQCGR